MLELTYNHGVDSATSSAPATTTSRSASRTSTARWRPGRRGHRAGEAALPPRRTHRGARICFVRDPDGYRVELIRARRLPAPRPVSSVGAHGHLRLGELRLSSGEGAGSSWRSPSTASTSAASATRCRASAVEATLDVSHTTTGYSLRLRFETALEGPCMRCLEAPFRRDVDAREIDQPGGGRGAGRPTSRRSSSTCAPGRATRWRSRCRPRSSAARVPGSVRPLCENLNQAGPVTPSASPTRAGPLGRLKIMGGILVELVERWRRLTDSRNAAVEPYRRSRRFGELDATPVSSSYEAWQSSVVRKTVPASPWPSGRVPPRRSARPSPEGHRDGHQRSRRRAGRPGRRTSQRKSPSSARVTSVRGSRGRPSWCRSRGLVLVVHARACRRC